MTKYHAKRRNNIEDRRRFLLYLETSLCFLTCGRGSSILMLLQSCSTRTCSRCTISFMRSGYPRSIIRFANLRWSTKENNCPYVAERVSDDINIIAVLDARTLPKRTSSTKCLKKQRDRRQLVYVVAILSLVHVRTYHIIIASM